jgi:DNA polymerase III subunit epsilon
MTAFVALDFETADYGADSACAIALVTVMETQIVSTAHFLIRPPRRRFHFTYLHGIAWEQVAYAPTFGELWPTLVDYLTGVDFIAAHNAGFDRGVLLACCQAHHITPPPLDFLCTVRLARSTWRLPSNSLDKVCAYLNIPLRHHQADSDAAACARIVLAAQQQGARLSFLKSRGEH